MEFEKLFSGERKPNIYRIHRSVDLSNLPVQAQAHNFALFIFDGNKIHNESELYDQFEIVMQPIDYGRNWDAFYETIRVPEWIEAKGIILIYREFQNFMLSSKEDFDIL